VRARQWRPEHLELPYSQGKGGNEPRGRLTPRYGVFFWSKHMIREWLWQQRMKQVELSKLLKVDPAVVSLWARGIRVPPRKYWPRLSEVLKVSEKLLEEHFGSPNS
jgi:hypothetical protein